MFGLDLKEILFRIPAVLISISVHELCHGYAAYLLGDPTAKNNGRLTMNPIAHFDLYGTLCMLLFGFGWARPVPVNPMYFKNSKQGMSLVGLAGPLSNFFLALVFSVIFAVSAGLGLDPEASILAEFIAIFLKTAIVLNVSLGIFNLFPVPPLDGSKILAVVLPNSAYYKLMMYERYVAPILMLLLFVGVLDVPLNFLVGKVIDGINIMINAIAGVFV